jgi:hypothetical protein
MSAGVPKPILIDVKTVTGNALVENTDVLEAVDLETLVLPD